MLYNEYPDLALVEMHVTGPYGYYWAYNRGRSFYQIAGTPSVWFDGMLECFDSLPTVTQTYNWYKSTLLQCTGVPTDVAIDISATRVSGTTYHVSVAVTVEPGGQGKDMRVRIVQVVDHFPETPSYYRNTLRLATSYQDITVAPGATGVVERDMTFDADSWARRENMRIIAWVQPPIHPGPAAVYNAAVLNWPFETPAGDLDCSGLVEGADVDAFVLALIDANGYALLYPQCDRALADVNDDGAVNAGDIPAFVELLTGSGVYTPRRPHEDTAAASGTAESSRVRRP